MGEQLLFPHLVGVNWPSTVLHVWLRLHALGVPEGQPRFVPEIGHFAAPEVVEEEPGEDPDPYAPGIALRHPRGADYDGFTGRTTVQTILPAAARPRLKVNIRAETVLEVAYDAQGVETGWREVVKGRLAHFMLPLLAGLPGAGAPADGGHERPIEALTRQVCEAYPELTAALAPEVRDTLESLAAAVDEALFTADPTARERIVASAMERRDRTGAGEGEWAGRLRAAFLDAAGRLPNAPGGDSSLARLADALFLPDPAAGRAETLRFVSALWGDGGADTYAVRDGCAQGLRALRDALARDTPGERRRVVRELLEIMTTEAFAATAAVDCLWGLSWIHGPLADFAPLPPPSRRAGLDRDDTLERVALALLAALAAREPAETSRLLQQAANLLPAYRPAQGAPGAAPKQALELAERALALPDPAAGERAVAQVLPLLPRYHRLEAYRAAFHRLAAGIPAFGGAGDGRLTQLWRWADALFLQEPAARLDSLQRLVDGLDAEGPRGRESHAALFEALLGAMDEERMHAGRPRHAGTLLSTVGGFGPREVMVSLMRRWAEAGGFLGVGRAEREARPAAGRGYGEPAAPGRDCLGLDAFTSEDLDELWPLVALRRETADPALLFQVAARRLVHPDIRVAMRHYVPAVSRFDTLFVQPGATAVPGGRGQMLYPGVEVRVPLAEDGGDEAVAAREKLARLRRLFLPVCLRVEIIWQETVARLDRPTYLKSDAPVFVRFADASALFEEDQEENHDPVAL